MASSHISTIDSYQLVQVSSINFPERINDLCLQLLMVVDYSPVNQHNRPQNGMCVAESHFTTPVAGRVYVNSLGWHPH